MHDQADGFERQFRTLLGTCHIDRVDLEQHLVADGGGASRRVGQFATHHQLGQLPSVDLVRGGGGHRRALADDGDVVAHRQHLVEFVRDEDDRGAVVDQAAQGDEQLVDLLGHQHRRGFVEDEDAGTAVEHLQDLDSLALADTERAHRRIEVEVDPE